MQDPGREDESPGLSFREHAAWICGGAIGGCAAMFFIAVFVFPNVFHASDLGQYLCGSTVGMLTGWLAGFALRVATERFWNSRWTGFCGAALAGGWFTAVFAMVLGAGAGC